MMIRTYFLSLCAALLLGVHAQPQPGGGGSPDRDTIRTCQPGGTAPTWCRGCVCLNTECADCVDGQECQWYRDANGCQVDDECTEGIVSCITNPCDDATCPAYPGARCRANYCGGCNAEFFDVTGEVECDECSEGIVSCITNPCDDATCPAYPGARCRANYCGGCNAEFFDSIGEVECDECKEGIVQCLVNPCIRARCPAYPGAKCRANYCGGCNAEFFDENGEEVECAVDRTCQAGDVRTDCQECVCLNAKCAPCDASNVECQWSRSALLCQLEEGIVAECQADDPPPTNCIECECNAAGLCQWKTIEDCGPDFDRDCEDGDTPPNECLTCTCDDTTPICSWERIPDCRPTGGGSTGNGGRSCEPGDVNPRCSDCVCLNDDCEACDVIDEECEWSVSETTCQLEAGMVCSESDEPPRECFECLCEDTTIFCKWMRLPDCRPTGGAGQGNMGRSCEEGDVHPECSECVCLNDACEACDAFDEECEWSRSLTLCQLEAGLECNELDESPIDCVECICDGTDSKCVWTRDRDCEPNFAECEEDDSPPNECLECTCDDTTNICSWIRIPDCRPTGGGGAGDADGACSVQNRNRPPIDCEDCVCLNADCVSCSGRQECSWFTDVEECEEEFGGEEFACTVRDRPPSACPDCVCLNYQCTPCVGQQQCEWYDSTAVCEPAGIEGIECPGNRPISPCGDVDPCDALGPCSSNPDLMCAKYECSRCQARFYNSNGEEEECPDVEESFCTVPGRDTKIKLGRTFDNPEDPCQLCTCGRDKKINCTTGRDCGNQQRFKMRFRIDDCLRVLSDPDKREAFIDTLKITIANMAEFSPEQIKDILATCGSIVIEATLVEKLPDNPKTTTFDLEASVGTIEKQVQNGSLVIVYDGQTFVPFQDSFTPVTPTTQSPISQTVVIVIAIAAAIVLLVLIIAVTVCCVKSNKNNSNESQRDVPMQRQPGYTNNGYGEYVEPNGSQSYAYATQPPTYQSKMP